MPAYFGPPAQTFIPGGTHIAVYLVPVFEGRLTVFDVAAREARGRWLPWDILDWGANPYEAASALVDQWCDVPASDLRLVDVMSFPFEGGGWELAIVFRAELPEPARGDGIRAPHIFAPGQFDELGNFDPVDLERWVTGTVAPKQAPASSPEPDSRPKLLF
jgi:hypothetical protein